MQKAIVGLLILTIIGAIGVGIYDATRTDPSDPAEIAGEHLEIEEELSVKKTTGETPNEAQQPEPAQVPATDSPAEPQQPQAQNTVGDPWTGSGTITEFDQSGMDVLFDDGTQAYVELGPSFYWQAQDVTLEAGDAVEIAGFSNGEQIHAATIMKKADGVTLRVRTDTGEPMWSGGQGSGQAQSQSENGQQVDPEDWITLNGTVTALNGANITIETVEEGTLTLNLGQPNFWEEQGISFAVGEAVEILGFWQGDQFRPGDIIKTATGERLMLLDPNGRPLWGGPGRSANQSSSGNGGGGQGRGQGQSGSDQSQGQSGGGQGQGQGQGRGRSTSVPSGQWETLTGTVEKIESLSITVQTETESARIALGEVDFWTEQGSTFTLGDALEVRGYWLNGQFEAGEVTFVTTGETLRIRDDTGRLLWTNTTSQGQGGGQGSQGGGQGGQGGGQGGQGGSNGRGYRGGH